MKMMAAITSLAYVPEYFILFSAPMSLSPLFLFVSLILSRNAHARLEKALQIKVQKNASLIKRSLRRHIGVAFPGYFLIAMPYQNGA